MLAVDDGLFSGNFNFADFCFLIATIVFAIALVMRALVKPKPNWDSVLIAAGFTAVALGWLVI